MVSLPHVAFMLGFINQIEGAALCSLDEVIRVLQEPADPTCT